MVAGGGLLGYIAGEIAIEDVTVKPWVTANAPWLHYAAPIAGVVPSSSRSACGSLVAIAPPYPLTDAVRQISQPPPEAREAARFGGSASLSQQWQRPVKLAA